MKKAYLECGKVVSPHGIKGELKVQPWCDGPEFLAQFSTLYLDERGEQSLTIQQVRPQKGMALLKVEGVETMDEANAYRGKVLYMRRAEVSLPEDSYFIQELVGLTVRNADDPAHVYGVLSDVSSTGANDVYHLRMPNDREALFPAIPLVVIGVDLDEGVMEIRPMEGLFDDAL